jgi:hypothetical protein
MKGDFEKKYNEISAENKLMLEELVKYRRGRKPENVEKEERKDYNSKERKSPSR